MHTYTVVIYFVRPRHSAMEARTFRIQADNERDAEAWGEKQAENIPGEIVRVICKRVTE